MTFSGALFLNTKKEKENQPDYRGVLESKDDENEKYEIAGWVRTSKAGQDYISLLIKPQEERGDRGSAPKSRELKQKDEPKRKTEDSHRAADEDDLPF